MWSCFSSLSLCFSDIVRDMRLDPRNLEARCSCIKQGCSFNLSRCSSFVEGWWLDDAWKGFDGRGCERNEEKGGEVWGIHFKAWTIVQRVEKILAISKSFKKDFILFNYCILIELQSALVVVIKRVKYWEMLVYRWGERERERKGGKKRTKR